MELSVETLADLVERKRREHPRSNPNEVLDEVLDEQGYRFPDFGRMRRQVAEALFDRNISTYLEDPNILRQIKKIMPKVRAPDEVRVIDADAIRYAIEKVERE